MKAQLNLNRLVSSSVLALVLTCGSISQAALLVPGGSFANTPGEVDPVGATVLFTTNITFSSASFSGVLTSSVLTSDASNPFGLGDLTFTYRYTLDVLSPDASSAITIGSFSGFQTDVSYQTPSVGLAPVLVSRNPLGSQAIKFDFSGVGYLLPGMSSALLVVQTDARAWTAGIASIQDNSASPDVATIVPVPEPAGISALVLGLGALIFSWRLKRAKQI